MTQRGCGCARLCEDDILYVGNKSYGICDIYFFVIPDGDYEFCEKRERGEREKEKMKNTKIECFIFLIKLKKLIIN